jgi:hypothetical protein
MQAIRQILDVKSHSLNIHLPNDFNAEKVEVIILPLEEEKEKKKGVANLRGKLNLSDAQYNDFQEDVKNSREGWEKNI